MFFRKLIWNSKFSFGDLVRFFGGVESVQSLSVCMNNEVSFPEH